MFALTDLLTASFRFELSFRVAGKHPVKVRVRITGKHPEKKFRFFQVHVNHMLMDAD